jgi:hypothetical protein
MTKPALLNEKYVFELSHTSMEVDPKLGGRVTSFRAEGHELLTGPAVDPVNFGSTFWTSPQLDWDVWPPVAALDNEAYSVVNAERELVLQSGRGRQGKVDASVIKRFRPLPEREGMHIEYVIRNEADHAQAYAPWEVTRVFTGGLSFYESGTIAEHGGNAPLATQNAVGHTWYAYDATKILALHNKLYAHSNSGFLAHVTSERVLLVKTFPVISPTAQAPEQGMIEIYATGKHTYVEVEQQGPHTLLSPGQTLTWGVSWFARKLPAEIKVDIGSESLIAFVHALIG